MFDIKMNLNRKARVVAGGHVTNAPSTMTYTSVVSRESAKIALVLTAPYECEILTGDIINAQLTSSRPKNCITKLV